MSGRLQLREAIHANAARVAKRHAPVERATVVVASPLKIRMFGYGHDLTLANDFDLSSWMKLYQSKVGLEEGDLVLLAKHDTLVVFDVVSSANVVTAFA